MSHHYELEWMARPRSRSSQVSLRTVFTVCFGVAIAAAFVLFVIRTHGILTLALVAAMIAVALDHLVHFLQRHRFRRGWAILLVIVASLLLFVGVLLLVIPAAVSQGRELVKQAPSLFEEVRHSRVFSTLDRQFGLEQLLRNAVSKPAPGNESGAGSILGAIGGVVSAVAGAATLAALVVFMLIFGPGLVAKFFQQFPPAMRNRWERVATRAYTSVGGYLGGLMVICGINAALTTICLALLKIPFFLPLGILSGFSSTVPYAGPVVVAVVVTTLTLLTGGALKAGLVVGYFVLYGQLEGNVLGPYIFRRTVNLDPLVTLLSILFLAEFMGAVGAVLAVPVVAVGQVVLRDLLADRRERSRPAAEAA